MTYDTPGQRPLPLPEQASTRLISLLGQALWELSPRDLLPTRGRPARMSDHLVAAAVLWCMLHGWVSQWDLWRRISFFGVGDLPAVPVSDQAVYNRLHQRGTALMQQMCAKVTQWLFQQGQTNESSSLASFAREVLLLDESQMRTMHRWLCELRDLPAGDRGLLAGRLVSLFDVRRHLWRRIDWLPDALVNCQVQAQEMLDGLKAGTLLLFDLGYYNFEWFDTLTERGIWWISRMRSNGSYTIQHFLVQRDGYTDALVWLGAYRSDQAKYVQRLVSVRYQGKWYRYLTNCLDPRQVSGADIAKLYARRWDIELGFRMLKDHLGLNLLWSAKDSVIGMQIWATVLVAQLLHAFQVQVAAEAGVETFDVSLELLWRYVPELAQQAARQGCSLVSHIAQVGRQIKIIRPSTRIERSIPHIEWWEIRPIPIDLGWIRTPRYSHHP